MTTIGRVSTLRKWIDPDMALFDFSAMSVNDPRITMVGGANRTFIDDDRRLRQAAANEMRFERGNDGQRYWRLDPQATNLTTWSGTPSSHGSTNVTRTGNVVFAGYKMTKVAATNIATSSHYLIANSGPKLAVGTVVSGQAVIKPAECRFAIIHLLSGGILATNTLDLNTGALLSPSAKWRVERLADGCFLVLANGFPAIDGSFETLIRVFPNYDAAGTSYAGDGKAGLWVGGCQVEVGAMCTSFIETGAAAVTRPGEQASISGQSFSDIFNVNAFTLLSDVISTDAPAITSVHVAISSPNSGFEYVYQGNNATFTGLSFVRPPGASSQTNILSRAGVFSAGRGRIGSRYSGTEFSGIANGAIANTAALAPLSTADRINFGALGNSTTSTTVFKLASVRLYRRALSDTEFSTLTRQ